MSKEIKKENIKNNTENKEFVKVKKTFFSFFDKAKKEISKTKKVDNLKLLESDLIKDEVPVIFEFKKHLMAFFALLLISFVLIMELYFFLSWWEKNKSEENSYYLENEIHKVMEERKNLENEYNEAMNFKNKMNVSLSFLNKHIYWNNFFLFLEDNTLKNVYFQKFSGDTSGFYILPAITDDIRAVSYQSRSFSSDKRASNVSISDEEIGQDGLSSGSGLVNFNININLNSRVFNDL